MKNKAKYIALAVAAVLVVAAVAGISWYREQEERASYYSTFKASYFITGSSFQTNEEARATIRDIFNYTRGDSATDPTQDPYFDSPYFKKTLRSVWIAPRELKRGAARDELIATLNKRVQVSWLRKEGRAGIDKAYGEALDRPDSMVPVWNSLLNLCDAPEKNFAASTARTQTESFDPLNSSDEELGRARAAFTAYTWDQLRPKYC